MCTHPPTHTHTNNSGEISQEQRYIPQAGSNIDWAWKLSRAECISRATFSHINKQPHGEHSRRERLKRTYTYGFAWILRGERKPRTAAMLTTYNWFHTQLLFYRDDYCQPFTGLHLSNMQPEWSVWRGHPPAPSAPPRHPSGPLFLPGTLGVRGTMPNCSFISLNCVVKSTSATHVRTNAQGCWCKECEEHRQLQHIIHYGSC